MAQTFAEKILAKKGGVHETVPGQIVEVTPDAIRIRKIHLLEHERKRASRQKDEA